MTAMLLLLYIGAIGHIQLGRMQTALELSANMQAYEAYTYCKAQTVNLAKQALREQQIGVQQYQNEDCEAELWLAEEQAHITIRCYGRHTDTVISYDHEQDIFSE